MVSLRTLTLYLPRYQIRHWQSPPGGFFRMYVATGYSPVPVSWHPVHSIVLQILIIHFGFYQPFHQGTSLQGLPLSSSCHIANAIHLIVLGDNIQYESYLDREDFTPDTADVWCIGSGCVSIYQVSVSHQGRVTLVLLLPLYLTVCFSSGISHWLWLYTALSWFIAVRVKYQPASHESVRIHWNSKQGDSLRSLISIIPCHQFTCCCVTAHMFLPARLWHDWGGWDQCRHSPALHHRRHCSGSGYKRHDVSVSGPAYSPHSTLAHFSSKAESDIAGFATPLSISRKMDRPGLEWKAQTAKIINWDREDEKIFWVTQFTRHQTDIKLLMLSPLALFITAFDWVNSFRKMKSFLEWKLS